MTLALLKTNAYAESIASTNVLVDKEGKFHWFFVYQDLASLKSQQNVAVQIKERIKKLPSVPYPLENVQAAGIGGNENTGFIYYDGQPGEGHAETLSIQRNPITKICYLQNDDIIVRDWSHDLDVAEFSCLNPDQNGLYWYPGLDFTNGSYNPGLDAFYAAQVADRLYQHQYYEPVWKKLGSKRKIILLTHAQRSYFNDGGLFASGNEPWFIVLSDGDAKTFPGTTLENVSFLISIGNALSNWGYSWGVGDGPSIATSFGDIFAKAVEYEVTGKNNWVIGQESTKGAEAWRHMDEPTKTCNSITKRPGYNCPIDNYDDYLSNRYLEAEYGAGLLDKVFYLIATSPRWNTKKAFHLVLRATYYWEDRDWNPDSNKPIKKYLTFPQVSCSLIKAAQDLNYSNEEIEVVIKAIEQVHINITGCFE